MNPFSTISVLPMPFSPGAKSSSPAPAPAAAKPVGYFWKGANGNVYVQGENGINSAGKWDANSAAYWGGKGFVQTPDSPTQSNVAGASTTGGYSAPAKVVDTAQVQALESLLGSYDQIRGSARQKNTIKRDTSLREKEEEKKREEGKYQGKKITTLQDFSGAKTDTDLGTTRTLENLISSLSTMGLGGSRALQRQILDAANMSNRKANATQATTNKELDTSFNDYAAGNENDVKKIQDQFGYDEGEAERKYNQDKQTTLYKLADTYDNGGDTARKQQLMRQGSDLNSLIAGSAFLNPSYTGETRAMATPELADYTQDIAKYDTSGIGIDGGMTPVGDGTGAGNLAVRAIAVNDKDLGIKKKTENELGLGV